MAFLTIVSIDVRVVDDSAIDRTPLLQGGRQRMRANNLLSTEDPTTAKRVLDCAIDLYDATEETALRAACPRGEGVAVSGDFPGTSLTMVVDIGDAALFQWEDGGTLIYKTVPLHMEEV